MCQFIIHSVILSVDSCLGYRLCLWHHKRAVLSAHSEVGQWCGWSESITTLISLPCTCCPSRWPSICTMIYWTVDAHCTPNSLVWVTGWWSLSHVLSCLFVLICFPAVCSRQGAEDLGRKQVWWGARETGDKGPREQGLIEPHFVLCQSVFYSIFVWNLTHWVLKYSVGFFWTYKSIYKFMVDGESSVYIYGGKKKDVSSLFSCIYWS